MPTNKLLTSDDPKGRRFIDVCRNMYDQAGLMDGPDESGQQLNEDKEFAKKLLVLIKECSTMPFGPEELIFEFMVPISANDFAPYFVYGKKYQASFYPLQRSMSSKSCRDFLKEKKSILAGKQGIAFLEVMNLFRNLPKGLVIFFGEEDDKVVPYIQAKVDSVVDKSNGAVELAWPVGAYIISFREVQ